MLRAGNPTHIPHRDVYGRILWTCLNIPSIHFYVTSPYRLRTLELAKYSLKERKYVTGDWVGHHNSKRTLSGWGGEPVDLC